MKDKPTDSHEDIVYPPAAAFLSVHVACLAVLVTGMTVRALVLGFALYWIRIFGISAGYHRYFSHRAFKTSRFFQFCLGFLSQTSAQSGMLWWAEKHRQHHRYSDTELDVHSPRRDGVFYAHVGWIFAPQHASTDYQVVRDLACYPELRWLDRHPYLPATVVAFLSWLIAGWPGLVVGFCWSTVAVWHVTFSINSIAHLVGRQPYVTGDFSRNNWLLALLTMGEGWHNNHHAYQSAARQGFRWWQYDVTFYILKLLSFCGILWELQSPPASLLRGEQRLGSRVIEKVAQQLAASVLGAEVLCCLCSAPGSGRSPVNGGRFNRPGVEALYLSVEPETALAEYRQGATITPPATLVAYRVDVDGVVDLSGRYDPRPWPDDWAEAGCDWKYIARIERRDPPTWRIGDALIRSGVKGLLFPSYRHPGGTNLVLFSANLGPADRFVPHDPGGKLPRDQRSWT